MATLIVILVIMAAGAALFFFFPQIIDPLLPSFLQSSAQIEEQQPVNNLVPFEIPTGQAEPDDSTTPATSSDTAAPEAGNTSTEE